MKKNNIHLINLAILAGYMLLFFGIFKGPFTGSVILLIAMQVFINFILFFANIGRNGSLARTYLLSAFLVLLVGFSTCVKFW